MYSPSGLETRLAHTASTPGHRVVPTIARLCEPAAAKDPPLRIQTPHVVSELIKSSATFRHLRELRRVGDELPAELLELRVLA